MEDQTTNNTEEKPQSRIIFPFKPNERVKAAFKQESARKEVLRIMTEALSEAYINTQISPWEILLQEHPEFEDIKENLAYNSATNSITIKSEQWKKLY